MQIQAGQWKFGEWRKIPFFVHWVILFWLPWYGWVHKSLLSAVLAFVAVVGLLFCHEWGHAAMALWRGSRVYAIRLHLFHGLCEYERPRYEKDDVFIAWGGVLAQLVVLVLAMAASAVVSAVSPAAMAVLSPVFWVLIEGNLFMCAFNLIPVAPLDGHKAWRAIPLLLGDRWYALRHTLGEWKSALNFKRRRAEKKASQRAAQELFDRLRKK